MRSGWDLALEMCAWTYARGLITFITLLVSNTRSVLHPMIQCWWTAHSFIANLTSAWPCRREIIRKAAGSSRHLNWNRAWPWRTFYVYHTNEKSITGIIIFTHSTTQTCWLPFLVKQGISISLSIFDRTAPESGAPSLLIHCPSICDEDLRDDSTHAAWRLSTSRTPESIFCLESRGCHLLPLSYLLSCSSA